MYKEHYSFHTPDKPLTIWRYIDFAKYVDLLLKNQLFFNRSDNFDDPFEGYLKLKDHKDSKDILALQEQTKKFYFLNCWHINENQSDAMWKIFLNAKNGIAIKSTIASLIKGLESAKEDIYISKLFYRDFSKVTFTELLFENQNEISGGRGGGLNQFNYKRDSFEHEKELRLYYIDLPIPHAIKDGVPREPLTHKRIDVDLKSIVHEIVVAPFADNWFKELVDEVTKKLDYNFKITKSNLYKLDD